ncbi:MAG: hypothetical protein ACREJM_06765, partial [Candidatus Saccharimonadales bacterium]
MYKQRGSVSKKVLTVGIVVVLAVAGGLYLHFHNRNPKNLVNSKSSKTVSGSTSKPTPHQQPTGNGSSISGQS